MEETSAPANPTVSHPHAAWRSPWLYAVLALLFLLLWQAWDTRDQLSRLREDTDRRVAEAESGGNEERLALRAAQEQNTALQARLAALEGRFNEMQGQSAALQGLYQELARSREEAALLEVEQAITLAAQNLQMTGQVSAAVLALQTADARLARLDRPQLAPLRKAVAKDIDRLRALPFADLAGMSVKLENLVLSVDRLPMAVTARPVGAAPTGDGVAVQGWRRLLGDFWQEIRSMVRIQRFDRDEPPLLAPGQEFFLRENLKLRLLNARLALLSRDQVSFRAEMRVAQDWLGRHFDARDKTVQTGLAVLRQLASAELSIEPLNLGESLAALRGLKSGKGGR